MADDLLPRRVLIGFQTDLRAQRSQNFNVVAGLFEVFFPILTQLRVDDALQSRLINFDPALLML